MFKQQLIFALRHACVAHLIFLVTNPLSELAPVQAGLQSDAAEQCALGVQLFFDGQAAEAFPLLSAGFAGREKATFADPDAEGQCAFALGKRSYQRGNGEGALAAYQVVSGIFRLLSNREFEGRTKDQSPAGLKRASRSIRADTTLRDTMRWLRDGSGAR